MACHTFPSAVRSAVSSAPRNIEESNGLSGNYSSLFPASNCQMLVCQVHLSQNPWSLLSGKEGVILCAGALSVSWWMLASLCSKDTAVAETEPWGTKTLVGQRSTCDQRHIFRVPLHAERGWNSP